MEALAHWDCGGLSEVIAPVGQECPAVRVLDPKIPLLHPFLAAFRPAPFVL